MKYKEAIIESLNTMESTTAIIDGEECTVKGKIPRSFPRFIMNLSGLLVCCSDYLLLENFPTFANSDNADENKSETTAILRVLGGADFFRNMNLFLQTHGFLGWLLEEEIPEPEEDADDWDDWYDFDSIIAKWDEFNSLKRSAE